MWQNYTSALLGLLLIGMAFVGSASTTYAWAFGILGAIIALVGFWGGAELPEQTTNQTTRHA